jgi:hypothetical protein
MPTLVVGCVWCVVTAATGGGVGARAVPVDGDAGPVAVLRLLVDYVGVTLVVFGVL